VDDILPLLAEHTAKLLRTARTLEEATTASLCTGWSRGHVLTHLARNADGLGTLVRAAVDGTGEPMYRGNAERDADIEAGADRPLPALVADVEDSATALTEAFARLRPEHADLALERTPGQPVFTAGALPFLRLREVVYHHVDLDAGFGFADVEPRLVERFLDDERAATGPEPDRPATSTTTTPAARAAELLRLARGIGPVL
jgi:maleylpyruvate isomerase